MAKVSLRPLDERVVVEPQEAEEMTDGGIVLPDTAKDKPQRGKVLAIGAGRLLKDGSRKGVQVKVGDTVSAGQPIGVVSGTAQLHTEVYAPGVTQNIKWPVGSPPPPQMRNPTQLLLDLAANGRRLTPDAPRLTVATAAP